MRILITIMLLWSSAIAFSQEIWQLSPWAPDSSYVIGAYPSGEPKWVKVDSLGVADSIYLAGDTIRLRDGSGSVILPCEQVYEIFIDKFTGVYTYPSEPVACGAFGYCEDPRTLFYYDGETWNIMVRDARITTSNDYPDKDEVIPLENADIYIDQDTTWFFTWENGWQIFSTKFKTDTLLITQIISDSLANITTEPDSIQRSGNIISLRDGSGSVDISDLVNTADSTSVLNSYGTIISETPANTFNVKVDSSLFATTYDITQKQNIITGTSGQTLRFDGTNTLIANSLLYNVGNQIGIGTITPTASYILDVAGNTKVRDGFLTVDGTVFINASNTLNMYNAANTGIFHSYQDGATSTDNIVYRGQHKTFTIGYNAGAGQSYANVANKKLHINGAVSIGDGVSATSVAANSLLVQGSATVQDRTGTATTLGGFDTNGKMVGVSLGTGLSWSGNTLNGNVGTVTGSGVATRVAFWNGNSSLNSNSNLYWDNVNNALGIGTSAPSSGAKLHIENGDFFVIGGNNRRFLMGSSVSQGFWGGMRWNTSNQLQLINSGYNENEGVALITSNGYVGLRTSGTAPITPLDVFSSNTSDNGTYQNWAYSVAPTSYRLLLKQSVTSGNVRYNFSQVNNGTAYDNVLVFNQGKVGIGLIDPTTKLHVAGNMTVDTRTGTPATMAAFTTAGVLCETTLPTSPQTWGDFTSNIQSWNSTGTFGSGKDVGIGGQPTQDFDVNGNARLRGAIYNSSNSAGTSGQVLTSQGTGSWIWSTPVDQSTTNELQNLSLAGQSLGISSGNTVTLPIVDVVAGSGTSVSKVSGVATVSLSTILGQLSVDGNNSLSVTTSYTKLPFTSQAWNGTTTSTSTYDIQVPSDGFYELSFSGNFTENSASKIYGAFFINSTEQLRSRISSVALGTTDPINLSTSGIFLLSANDYISFRVKDTYVSNTLTYYSPTLSVKKL